MAFVLKKSRPVRVTIGDTVEKWERQKREAEKADEEFSDPKPSGEDTFVLVLKRIKVEKLMQIFAEHQESIKEIQKKGGEAKEAGDKEVFFSADNIELMQSMKDAVLEATENWEGVVDEKGKDIPYKREALEELIAYDIGLYGDVAAALNATFGDKQKALEASTKN